jgi:hypothetical protein
VDDRVVEEQEDLKVAVAEVAEVAASKIICAVCGVQSSIEDEYVFSVYRYCNTVSNAPMARNCNVCHAKLHPLLLRSFVLFVFR